MRRAAASVGRSSEYDEWKSYDTIRWSTNSGDGREWGKYFEEFLQVKAINVPPPKKKIALPNITPGTLLAPRRLVTGFGRRARHLIKMRQLPFFSTTGTISLS